MKFRIVPGLLLLFSFTLVQAQPPQSQDDQPHIQPRNLPPEPKTDTKDQPKDNAKPEPPRDSSSKDSQINLEGPSKSHGGGSGDVHELYPYDPHKAEKDIEVGEFYLKRKDYHVAMDRFNEALQYKPNDALATFRLAQTQEKLGLNTQAVQNYSTYIKVFPEGQYVKEAQEALKRVGPLASSEKSQQPSGDVARLVQQGEAELAQNDFEDAHKTFVNALQIAPDDAVANYRLAESLQGLHRLDEARIFYRKYLSLDPNGKLASEAKRQIGQIEQVLGKG
jgi:tetratricopeptide (TPR) repeat protein